jgi:hypothetical protein
MNGGRETRQEVLKYNINDVSVKAHRGRRGGTPLLILIFGTSWKQVVNITSLTIYPK